MSGAQLTHSQYMQTLCSLAVALHLEKILCTVPTPPHHRQENQGKLINSKNTFNEDNLTILT